MRILLLEDDQRLADSAVTYLRRSGMAVDLALTGEQALQLSAVNDYDVAVIDILLAGGGIDGLEVCRRLRALQKPTRILLATARDAVEDRIAGLDLGADDYLVKPYALGELVARLRALLRRPAAVIPVTLEFGDLALDTGTRVARRGARTIELTTKEFSVLEYLMRHAGEVVTRERLSAHAWDDSYDSASNVIDVYLARLRRKIDHPDETPLISTIRGAGYRLGVAAQRKRA